MKKALFSLLCCLLLSSCYYPPLRVELYSSKFINRGHDRRALPVVVVIYQLRSLPRFKQATFHELWLNDHTTLGHSLLSKQQITINPNSYNKLLIKRTNGSNYIGVIAIFNHPEMGRWRDTRKLAAKIPLIARRIRIFITNNSIKLQ